MQIISTVVVAALGSINSHQLISSGAQMAYPTFMWPTKRLVRLPNQSYYCLIIQLWSRWGGSLLCSVPNESHFFTAVYVYTVLLSMGFLSSSTGKCLLQIYNYTFPFTLFHSPSKRHVSRTGQTSPSLFDEGIKRFPFCFTAVTTIRICNQASLMKLSNVDQV